jgi:hypothetical protein
MTGVRYARWDVPIPGEWTRANELVGLAFSRTDELVLRLLEGDSRRRWTVAFGGVWSFRVVSEEASGGLVPDLPVSGAFLEALDSPTLEVVGAVIRPRADKPRHFVIRLYDEVVEVIAASWRISPGHEDGAAPAPERA